MSDPTAAEMRDFLQNTFPEETAPNTESGLNFDVEAAIYWFANDWHGGQWSNLYSALSTSEYRPGPICCGPEPDSIEQMFYEALESEYSQ